MEPLTVYEIERTPLAPLPPETRVVVPPEVREELRCMVCFEILKESTAIAECLHRFCKGCAELAVRKFSAVETDSRSALRSRRKQAGGAECPLCRTNIASRRDLYEDRRFQSLVTALRPHVAAEEAAEQWALEARMQQFRRALLGQGPSSSSSPFAALPFPSRSPIYEQDEKEEEILDPEIAALSIVFGLCPLSAEAGGSLVGENGRWVLPSLGGKLFRTTAGATVLSIKRLLARRLCVPLPSHLELCLLFPPSPPSTDTDTDTAEMTVVVLDDALTLKDVVVEVWGKGADVSEELVLHYFLRGPGVAGLWGLENGIESGS